MKLVCERLALAEGLGAVTSVIATRTPKPILQCVRLTAQADVLTLTAYDQEVGLRWRVSQVEVARQGETLVMAERLAAIVRDSVDETVTLELGAEHLTLRGSDSEFRMVSQSVRDFPPVPDFEGEAQFRVNFGALSRAIERTVPAAARESTRYAINGVLWHRRGRRLQLVATDGRRLAWALVPVEKASDDECNAIVPTKAMTLLSRMKLDAEEPVDVQVHANQALFRAPRATVSTVLVEGHFPDFEAVIPRDATRTLEVNTQEFLSAVRRVAVMTDEESRGVRIALREDGVEMSSRASQAGDARVRVPVSVKGGPLDIGFNPAYLMDALKVSGDSVILELKDATKPGVLKSGTDFLYVIMPVTLPE